MLLLSSIANATIEKPFTIDNTQIYTDYSLFYNEKDMRPVVSDFKITSAITMSNEHGQRAALLNIKNLSSGSRTLEPHHLMVTYADGSSKVLTSLPNKLRFKGEETINLTVNLGKNLYPVISVLTSNNM